MNMHKLLARALRDEGGFYELSDIMAAISRNEMQSFTDGTTWVITRVLDFPRARVLELFLVVGAMEGVRAISVEVEEFARSVGATRLIAQGRIGWTKHAESFGWRPTSTNYHKDL